MRYGINIEAHGNGTDGRIEVSVSRADESREYRDSFGQRKRRTIGVQHLDYLEFDFSSGDPRTAAHFVAKTLEVKAQIQYPKAFSSNYTRGERWRLLYPSTERKGILSSIDFCNRFDILIIGEEDDTRKLQGYFEKVLKCDTDIAINRRAISQFLGEKTYNLIVFACGSHIVWSDTIRMASEGSENTQFAVVGNQDVVANAWERGVPNFLVGELVSLERQFIPIRYGRSSPVLNGKD